QAKGFARLFISGFDKQPSVPTLSGWSIQNNGIVELGKLANKASSVRVDLFLEQGAVIQNKAADQGQQSLAGSFTFTDDSNIKKGPGAVPKFILEDKTTISTQTPANGVSISTIEVLYQRIGKPTETIRPNTMLQGPPGTWSLTPQSASLGTQGSGFNDAITT